jgi:hypothetical protein
MSAETPRYPGSAPQSEGDYVAGLPENVLGVSTKQVLDIGETAIKMNAVVPEAKTALPEALSVLAAIEKVRDYQERTDGRVDIFNREETASGSRETAYEQIAKLEKEAKLLAGFENPREQFLKELDIVARETETAIDEHRDHRVHNKIPAETLAGSGFKGFCIKVFRKAKRFFGFLSGRPEVNPNVTAYDAAAGIEKTAKLLLKNANTTKERLPLLSGLVLDRLSSNNLPSRDKLAFLAPEILTSMFSALQPDSTRNTLVKKVEANPHEFRFVTKIGFLKDITTYKGISLEYIQAKSRTFLPSIRDIIPINGPMIGGMYDMAQQFLNSHDQNQAEGGLSDSPKQNTEVPEQEKEEDKPKTRKKSKRLWKKFTVKARSFKRRRA